MTPIERMFETHRVRKSRAAAPLWNLTTPDEGGMSETQKALVPGIWETIPALKNYQGRGIYEQEIECGGNVRLWLGGVSFRAKVWLDEALVCEHYGAYTGFEAIVKNVGRGPHTLRVEVDNRFGEDSALHVPNDYYSYGGINRPVLIEELGDAYISSLHITPKLVDGVWHALAKARVNSLCDETQHFTLRLSVAGEVGEREVRLDGGASSNIDLDICCPKAQTWTPEHPALPEASACLLLNGEPVDDLIDRIGFREIRVEGTKILLNDQPLRLKGFNRHEDFNDFGVSAPVEAMMRDLMLFKDLGANCVRTCHYPNDPRFLDLCDELGILVWEESHSRGLSEEQMRNPHFIEQLTLCTREMVEQHFNHPSIFIWASLNECADNTEYGAQCYREIYALLHELDASRPMTAALLERAGGLVFDASDVVSINIYPRWYHNTPVRDGMAKKVNEALEHGGQNKPLIVSEIGAGAIYGYHDPFGEAKWSEERQATILREQIEAVMNYPDCSGVFLWMFADARVCESWAIHRPRTFNNKGIVDEYRRPKLAYAAIKELFHKL